MNYIIKKLELSDIEAIYTRWIHEHFPPEEVKPLKNIQRMWEDHAYQGLALYESEECHGTEGLIGYAFFAMAEDIPMLLLDYYAVLEEYRSQGVGGIFLQEMKNYLPEYEGILLETEDIEHAQNEEERTIRQRRDRFYTRNGVQATNIKSIVYGVRYAIWYLPFQEMVDEDTCAEYLRSVYQSMVPGDKYIKNVKIGINL